MSQSNLPSSSPPLTFTSLSTLHGTLSISSVNNPDPSKPTLLLIHGNSSSSLIFRPIFSSALNRTHHIVAFDLPGHGLSSNAPNPDKSYTQTAYADAAISVLKFLGVTRVIVLGWSLGGHVGIEMMGVLCRDQRHGSGDDGNLKDDNEPYIVMNGLVITGTPPVRRGLIHEGFDFPEKDYTRSFAARATLTPSEQAEFAASIGNPQEPWMLASVQRTDPLARQIMFSGFAKGEVSDQRDLVAETDVPIAVINGKDESLIALEYIRNVPYRRLWRDQCFEIDGAGHTAFWEKEEEFLVLLEAYVQDVENS